jgi:hypothetical protein
MGWRADHDHRLILVTSNQAVVEAATRAWDRKPT